ncbi:hypothetical protein BDC45DRAFT_524166 [Circinella umbellata]|nr:hypothetical protein BDC45DRAFT_524166 [Circinella umbellata]
MFAERVDNRFNHLFSLVGKKQILCFVDILNGVGLNSALSASLCYVQRVDCVFNNSFGIQVNHATLHVLHRAKANIYTMSEVEHIQLAFKLANIPLFIAQSSKIAKNRSSFEYVLNCGTHQYDDHPPPLTDHILLQAINSKASRKRKSISSHYNKKHISFLIENALIKYT